MSRIVLIVSLTLVMAACSERDQAATAAKKPDTQPWQAAPTPYAVKGWTAGDKRSWETQMRSRAQTQNEYVKVE